MTVTPVLQASSLSPKELVRLAADFAWNNETCRLPGWPVPHYQGNGCWRLVAAGPHTDVVVDIRCAAAYTVAGAEIGDVLCLDDPEVNGASDTAPWALAFFCPADGQGDPTDRLRADLAAWIEQTIRNSSNGQRLLMQAMVRPVNRQFAQGKGRPRPDPSYVRKVHDRITGRLVPVS